MPLALLLIGFLTLLAQVTLLRELNVAFYGSELIYLLALGIWLLWTACGALQAMAPDLPAGITAPVVFVDPRLLPPGEEGDANAVLRVRFDRRTVTTANLRGVVPAADGRTTGRKRRRRG